MADEIIVQTTLKQRTRSNADALSKATTRSPVRRTVGTMAAAWASCAASTSTSTRNLSARTGATRPASVMPCLAADRIAAAVTSGGRQTAAYRLTQSLTATAGTPGP